MNWLHMIAAAVVDKILVVVFGDPGSWPETCHECGMPECGYCLYDLLDQTSYTQTLSALSATPSAGMGGSVGTGGVTL